VTNHETRPLRSPAFGLLSELGAIVYFLGLALVATRPLAWHLSGKIIRGIDPLSHLWTIHWLASHALDPARVFQGNTFHPSPYAVLYSDISLGTVVLVAPFRPFISDPVPLFNLAVLLCLTFSGWAFHALVRDLTGCRWVALVSGTLAAFGSHQLYHIDHINLLSTGWLALFLLGLRRIVQLRPAALASPTSLDGNAASGSLPDPSLVTVAWGERKHVPGSAGFSLGPVLLTGVSASLTAQSSGYYAVAAVILALVFAMVERRALFDRAVQRALVAAALLAVVLTVPYVRAYGRLRSEQGLWRPGGMSVTLAFQPARDLTSHGYLYRAALASRGQRLFPGLLTLGLATLAIVRRRPDARFYAWAVAVLLLISLGPRIEIGCLVVPLPYRALAAVGPLDGMRHPYTFAGVAVLLMAVLAGIGLDTLRRRRAAVPLAFAAALLETFAPGPRLHAVPPGLPPAYRLLETLPPGPFLEVPPFEPMTLAWAARHGRPTLNGQGSAFVPVDTLRLSRYVDNHWLKPEPSEIGDDKATRILRERLKPRYVIVPCGRKPELAALAAAFDRSPAYRFVAMAEDGDRVYELLSER
jgi:hypothetical protein